jgi:hypothetical protein
MSLCHWHPDATEMCTDERASIVEAFSRDKWVIDWFLPMNDCTPAYVSRRTESEWYLACNKGELALLGSTQ